MSDECFADAGEKAGDIQEVTLAVLGAPAVGKSTFVRSSLDLKKPPTSPVSSKKVSLEGKISIVRLLELGFENLEITSNQSIRWPTKVGNHNTPRIDGVLALYNVMDQGSISRIPTLLSESFWSSQSFLLCETMRRWELVHVFWGRCIKHEQ